MANEITGKGEYAVYFPTNKNNQTVALVTQPWRDNQQVSQITEQAMQVFPNDQGIQQLYQAQQESITPQQSTDKYNATLKPKAGTNTKSISQLLSESQSRWGKLSDGIKTALIPGYGIISGAKSIQQAYDSFKIYSDPGYKYSSNYLLANIKDQGFQTQMRADLRKSNISSLLKNSGDNRTVEQKLANYTHGQTSVGLDFISDNLISSIVTPVASYIEDIGYQVNNPWLIKTGASIADKVSYEFLRTDAGLEMMSSPGFWGGDYKEPTWYANTITQAIGSMGVAVGASAIGALVGGPAGATVGGGLATYGLEKGSSYRQYIEEGVSPSKASAVSNIYAIPAAILEMTMGFNPATFTRKLLNNSVKQVVSNVAKHPLYELAKTGISEGVEEAMQQLVQNTVSDVMIKDQKIWKNVAESFAGGAIGGLALGGGEQLITNYNKPQKYDYRKILQNKGLTNLFNTSVYKTSDSLPLTLQTKNKIDVTKPITTNNISQFRDYIGELQNIVTNEKNQAKKTESAEALKVLTLDYSQVIDLYKENFVGFKSDKDNYFNIELFKYDDNKYSYNIDAQAGKSVYNVNFGQTLLDNRQEAITEAHKLLDNFLKSTKQTENVVRLKQRSDTLINANTWNNKPDLAKMQQAVESIKDKLPTVKEMDKMTLDGFMYSMNESTDVLNYQYINKLREYNKSILSTENIDDKIIANADDVSSSAQIMLQTQQNAWLDIMNKYINHAGKLLKKEGFEVKNDYRDYMRDYLFSKMISNIYPGQSIKQIADTLTTEYLKKLKANRAEQKAWRDAYENIQGVYGQEDFNKISLVNEFDINQEDDPNTIQAQFESEFLQELEYGEGGYRVRTEDGDYTGAKSTIPDWIPEDLRNAKLIKSVVQHIKKGTIPTSMKGIMLYKEIESIINEKSLQNGLYAITDELTPIELYDEQILLAKEEQYENQIKREVEKLNSKETVSADDTKVGGQQDQSPEQADVDKDVQSYLAEMAGKREMYRVELQDMTIEQAKASGMSFDEWVKGQQKSIADKFMENDAYISEIQSLRHDIHSLDSEDIFNSESGDYGKIDEYIGRVIDLMKDINITGEEKQIIYDLQVYDESEGGERPMDTDFEFDEKFEELQEKVENEEIDESELEDYIDEYRRESFSFIADQKEKINNIIENYLESLDKKYKELDLESAVDNDGYLIISDLYSLKNNNNSFAPSGFARARSLLGEGSNNTAKNKEFEIGSEISQLKSEWDKVNGEKFRTGDVIEKKTGIKITDEQRKEIDKLNLEIFGDKNTDFIERLLTPTGQNALGSYKQNMIKIVEGQVDAKDTFYHEAVHKYIDLFTDIDERVGVLKEYKKEDGTWNEAEEVLAENFINYAKSREGIIGKIKQFFDNILNNVKVLLNKQNTDKITALYNDILAGKGKDIKERGFSKNVAKSDVAEAITKRNIKSFYQVEHNPEIKALAKQAIIDDPQKAFERVMSDEMGAEVQVIGQLLGVEFQKMGRLEDAHKVLERVMKKGTVSGKTSQIMSMWSKLSPENIGNYVSKIFTQYNDEKKFTGSKKVKLSPEELNMLVKQTEKMESLIDDVNEFGIPEKYFLEKKKLDKFIDGKTPNNQWHVFSGTIGRGMMLASVKSPVTNIIGNTVQGLLQSFEKRLARVQFSGLNSELSLKYVNMVYRVYQKTGTDVTRITSLESGTKTLGEKTSHSEGKGFLRAWGRVTEDYIFKQLMGVPDVVSASIAFIDTANLLSSHIATRQEKLAGIKAKQRAREMMLDSVKIVPETKEGAYIREQAILDAQLATFTNKGKIAAVGLNIREAINKAGGEIKAGDMIMPFVKTPANMGQMALETAGFGLPIGAYELYKAKKDVLSGDKKAAHMAIRQMIRAGLGITLAFVVGSAFDDEDILLGYPEKWSAEEKLLYLRGGSRYYHMVRIGDKWVSTDYFGVLQGPLLGLLYAKKYGDNWPNKALFYLLGQKEIFRQVPVIEELGELSENLRKAVTKKDSFDKVVIDLLDGAVDWTASRVIPGIVSDIAKMTDEYDRWTDGTSWGRIQKRIPGLRTRLELMTDQFGNEIKTPDPLWSLFAGGRLKNDLSNKITDEYSKLLKDDSIPSLSDVEDWKRFEQAKTQLGDEKYKEAFKHFQLEWKNRTLQMIDDKEYNKLQPEDKKKELDDMRSDVADEILESYGYEYESAETPKTSKSIIADINKWKKEQK